LQIGIILTANYAFLNYLVLALGIFLLDDLFLVRFVPNRWRGAVEQNLQQPPPGPWHESLLKAFEGRPNEPISLSLTEPTEEGSQSVATKNVPGLQATAILRKVFTTTSIWTKTFLLAWVFYAMAFLMLRQISPGLPLPAKPVVALEPFRIANSYGLFGRMTWARYEIEFQGLTDGANWVAYPFRYKPQNLNEAPGIYAPYQPRFEWNLWFASLGTWREYPFVIRTEEQLLLNNPDVLALFRSNPFAKEPPKLVRAVVWQYWFSDRATQRATGQWWRREFRGLYAPTLERTPAGRIIASEWPQTFIPPP